METKKLNIPTVQLKMTELGFSQSFIAEKMDLSREAISKWFNGESFPRPKALLQLARLLDLKFEQIVVQDIQREPVVAFRRKAHTKTVDQDYLRAKDMGELLKKLVSSHIDQSLSQPAILKDPVLDYSYIQAAAKAVRDRISSVDGTIDYDTLIQFFSDLNAVLIPVLWGPENRHENALHIYLPDSMTTWIYLNLDTNIIDFKFWMAHELGHVKAPRMRGNDGEDFADQFAAALLYPEEYAKEMYNTVISEKNVGRVVNKIKNEAKKFSISPITVYCQINAYAGAMKVEKLNIDNFHAAVSNYKKENPIVSEVIFGKTLPEASQFIQIVSSLFKTDFYNILKIYLKKENGSSGFVQRILDIPALDAEELYGDLIKK